jgi:hypothetical protein
LSIVLLEVLEAEFLFAQKIVLLEVLEAESGSARRVDLDDARFHAYLISNGYRHAVGAALFGSEIAMRASTRFSLARFRAELGGRRGSCQRKTSRRPSKQLRRRFVEDDTLAYPKVSRVVPLLDLRYRESTT